MDRKKFYRELGYQQGLVDGKRTGGQIKENYLRNLLQSETRNLTEKEGNEYRCGWQEGFTEAVSKLLRKNIAMETFLAFKVIEFY